MTSSTADNPATPTYRSGTAARLAGLPVATLRMWERRYGIVLRTVSSHSHRRYTRDDVARLAMLKALVDLGHPIGTLAHLPFETLRDMRETASAAFGVTRPASVATGTRPRVAVVGEALSTRAASEAPRFPALELVAACADPARAEQAFAGTHADVLAIELPSLAQDVADAADGLRERVGARLAIVAYRFAPEAALTALRARGHVALKAPIGLAQVESVAARAPFPASDAPDSAATIAPPRFDDATLARLAQSSTAIRCECPRHVADLLMSLAAFERYSADCEHRTPADAHTHRMLGRVAGAARTLFEDALLQLARTEGIAIPEPPEPEPPDPR